MREQKRIDTHGLNHPSERFRQMPIDKNGTTIATIPGDVGHIVLAADDLHAPSNRLHYIEQNRVINVFRFVPDFLLQFHGDLNFAAYTWINLFQRSRVPLSEPRS